MRTSSLGGIPPLTRKHGPLETMLAADGACKGVALKATVHWGLC